jgi:hypothetical protein
MILKGIDLLKKRVILTFAAVPVYYNKREFIGDKQKGSSY